MLIGRNLEKRADLRPLKKVLQILVKKVLQINQIWEIHRLHSWQYRINKDLMLLQTVAHLSTFKMI